MANSIRRGLHLIGRVGGGTPSVARYSVDASNSVAIFKHDPVKLESDGTTDYPAVGGMSAASNDFLGTVLGVFDSDGKAIDYLAASTAGFVDVCDDKDAIYEVQAEDANTALTSAAQGDQVDFVFTHSGNTNTGESGVEVGNALAGDGNNKQLIILRKSATPNNAWGYHVKLEVTPSEQVFKAAVPAV